MHHGVLVFDLVDLNYNIDCKFDFIHLIVANVNQMKTPGLNEDIVFERTVAMKEALGTNKAEIIGHR